MIYGKIFIYLFCQLNIQNSCQQKQVDGMENYTYVYLSIQKTISIFFKKIIGNINICYLCGNQNRSVCDFKTPLCLNVCMKTKKINKI